MNKSFVLHDETVNTYGFRMLTSGADLSEFRRNPVMLLNHNDYSLPIGRWENIRIEGTQILADPVFDTEDHTGKEIARKVEKGFLRMASMGAWPPEAVSDEPMYMLNGQTKPTVTRWKAREASIVTIGSNHNALALYDHEGNLIDLSDNDSFIKLFDHTTINSHVIMNEVIKLLNLSDTATQADQANAVRTLIADRDRLKVENVTLSDRIDTINKAEKDMKKTQAIALIDAAVKDGRIDAKGKEAYIKLFDIDFENANATLGAIPMRNSVAKQLENGAVENGIELADFTAKSWEDLDKAGKLVTLKDKYPDLYEQKFETRYGCKPKKD